MWYRYSNLNRYIPKISVGSLHSFYDLMCLIKGKKYSHWPYTERDHLLQNALIIISARTYLCVNDCVYFCVCAHVCEVHIHVSFILYAFLVTPIINTKILQLVLSCISFQIVRISDLFKKTHLLNHIFLSLNGEFFDIPTWKCRVILYFHFQDIWQNLRL